MGRRPVSGGGSPLHGAETCGDGLGPATPAADKALESGDPRPLLSLINGKVHEGIHKYFTEARERKAHAKDSVEAGRAYVQAYVPYLHFVERLYNDSVTPISHGPAKGGTRERRVPRNPTRIEPQTGGLKRSLREGRRDPAWASAGQLMPVNESSRGSVDDGRKSGEVSEWARSR